MTKTEHEKRSRKFLNSSLKYRFSKAGQHERHLLEWIEMINSCFAYNECECLEDYITGEKNYIYNSLTEQEKRDIADEHLKYLHEHADIVYNTYTDSEGCSYNDLLW